MLLWGRSALTIRHHVDCPDVIDNQTSDIQLNGVAFRFFRVNSRLLDAQLLVSICAELSNKFGEIVQSKAEDPFQVEIVGFGVEVLSDLKPTYRFRKEKFSFLP